MFIVIDIEGARDIRFALNVKALETLLLDETNGLDANLRCCRLARVPESWPPGYGTLELDNAAHYFVIRDGTITTREGVNLDPPQHGDSSHE
jgi:hypothetical protein